MRLGKRTLAGVAAGALAMGFLSVAGAASVSAAPKAKPKAAITSTVSAIRPGTVGTIPSAKLTIPKASAKPTTLVVVTAPTNAATITLDDTFSALPATPYDQATLLSRDDALNTVGQVVGDDSTYGISVDVAGFYTASLGNGTDTATFSFTTAGVPASLSWAPTTQSVTVGSTATMVLSLKDASGNLTQAANGDTIAVAASADDTPSDTNVTAAEIYAGSVTITAVAQSGTQTITATPQGTLPATGVTAASTTLTGSGSISSTTVSLISVLAPVKRLPGGTAPSSSTTAVPEGTTSVTVQVDDTPTASAGNVIRLKAVLSSGTLDGSATLTQYKDITTDAAKRGTWTLAIGGAGIVAGQTLIVSQVKVDNTAVSPAAQNTITQTAPAVSGTTVTVAPDDSLLKALGTTTDVVVSVKDQFGDPQSGWSVTGYRGNLSGTVLGVATTGALGNATIAVTNATGAVSGVVEDYSFKAVSGGNTVNKYQVLTIAYTTSGDPTSMSVNSSSGSDPSTTTPTLTTAPLLWVPDDTAAVPYGISAGTYTVATGAEAVASTGNLAQFNAVTSPFNQVTFTVPADVYVKAITDPVTGAASPPTAWNDGTTAGSLTVDSDDSVVVWSTKVGEHNLTVTSGNLSVALKVKAANRAQDAYAISVAPATNTVEVGAITQLTATVKDYWGNTVAGANLTANATGQVLLAGQAVTTDVTTGASGTATITTIAYGEGTGLITVIPKTGCTASTCPAWATGYTKPATFTTEPTLTALSEFTIGGVVTQSIAIVGSRGSADVSLPSDETCRSYAEGPPPRALPTGCVTVDGVTTGFDEGSAMTPEYRFPGQTSYTAGIDVTTNADGEFNWFRKTGKKIYVRFVSGDVVSSRVIIPAK